MSPTSTASIPVRAGLFYLITGLALSVGWGIRGNFGHEFGALLPGALAAMAAVLLSGRADWHRRVHHFGFLSALGWSFGGSISYMQVIAYTQSGHSLTEAYGFASLFVIGFLWAAPGGVGAGLPAFLDARRLAELFPALTSVFAAWVVQDVFETWLGGNPDFRHENPLYWYDTDWLAASTALVAVLLLGAVRRRWCAGCSLVASAAVGWWLGFVLLVLALGLRMTPPRGDNWAGMTGMVCGLAWWLRRQRLDGVLRMSLVTGVVGGLGFSGAAMLQLLELKTGWQTNWHSVLEQSYGLINGLGLAAALWWARRAAPVTDGPQSRDRWTEGFAVVFVLWVIPWLNQQKNVEDWVKNHGWPATMYGLSSALWFHAAWVLLLLVLVLLVRRGALPAALPTSWLGRGQWLFLLLLWWMIAGNFERALPGFAPQRLITEGVIHFHAVVLTLLAVLYAPNITTGVSAPASGPSSLGAPRLARVAVAGLAVMVAAVAVEWGVDRALNGDQPAGMHRLHIRFGPNANATKEKPKPGQLHP